MTYWISYSGGLGSAVSSIIAYEQGLDFEMLFADTLIEDDDLYRFNQDLQAALGKEITVLTDGRTPWEVFEDKRYIGNTRTAHCSTELKSKPVDGYLQEHARPDDPLVLGMDLSEEDRIERAAEKWSPRPVVSLINEYKVWRPKWDDLLAKYELTPPRLYDHGFPHNNCGGMCVKAGLKQFATLLERFPERFRQHEQRQEEAMEAIGPTARPFLRHTRDGVREYLTMKEFRRRYQEGELTISPYDFGGCACFTD